MATVYSKSGKKWGHDYEFSVIETLDRVDLESDDVIYYHHPYDTLIAGIPLYDSLDDVNWQHIKSNPTVCLVHDNDSETFDISFAHEVVTTINKRGIATKQLRIVVMDENHKEFLEKYLENAGIENVIVQVTNYLLNEVQIFEAEIKPIKKFSSLSRNYRIWRLRFYAELLHRGILENNFLYSFFNIWPYQEPAKVYSADELIEDLQSIGKFELTDSIQQWINHCPHELSTENNVHNKWSNATYTAIFSSYIHAIIETHYDQKEFSCQKEYDRLFAPSSITEKTYKPIACKKPFIAFSTPHWLEDLRKLGFKTFHPYINEDYDLVENNLDRLIMIADEIERISTLDETEFVELIKKCNDITAYNYNLLLEKKNAR